MPRDLRTGGQPNRADQWLVHELQHSNAQQQCQRSKTAIRRRRGKPSSTPCELPELAFHPDQCCVCYEPCPANGPRRGFGCHASHWVCSACKPRVDICPLCRHTPLAVKQARAQARAQAAQTPAERAQAAEASQRAAAHAAKARVRSGRCFEGEKWKVIKVRS